MNRTSIKELLQYRLEGQEDTVNWVAITGLRSTIIDDFLLMLFSYPDQDTRDWVVESFYMAHTAVDYADQRYCKNKIC